MTLFLQIFRKLLNGEDPKDEIAQLVKNPDLTIVDAFLTGTILLLDDSLDIGRFDRPHHWHLGLAMVTASLLAARALQKGENNPSNP